MLISPSTKCGLAVIRIGLNHVQHSVEDGQTLKLNRKMLHCHGLFDARFPYHLACLFGSIRCNWQMVSDGAGAGDHTTNIHKFLGRHPSRILLLHSISLSWTHKRTRRRSRGSTCPRITNHDSDCKGQELDI